MPATLSLHRPSDDTPSPPTYRDRDSAHGAAHRPIQRLVGVYDLGLDLFDPDSGQRLPTAVYLCLASRLVFATTPDGGRYVARVACSELEALARAAVLVGVEGWRALGEGLRAVLEDESEE